MKSHEEKDYTFFMTLNLKMLAKLDEEEKANVHVIVSQVSDHSKDNDLL